jgi:hypothetical protein
MRRNDSHLRSSRRSRSRSRSCDRTRSRTRRSPSPKRRDDYSHTHSHGPPDVSLADELKSMRDEIAALRAENEALREKMRQFRIEMEQASKQVDASVAEGTALFNKASEMCSKTGEKAAALEVHCSRITDQNRSIIHIVQSGYKASAHISYKPDALLGVLRARAGTRPWIHITSLLQDSVVSCDKVLKLCAKASVCAISASELSLLQNSAMANVDVRVMVEAVAKLGQRPVFWTHRPAPGTADQYPPLATIVSTLRIAFCLESKDEVRVLDYPSTATAKARWPYDALIASAWGAAHDEKAFPLPHRTKPDEKPLLMALYNHPEDVEYDASVPGPCAFFRSLFNVAAKRMKTSGAGLPEELKEMLLCIKKRHSSGHISPVVFQLG